MRQTSRPPWLGIELRHLAALSAIAREGSFRAAADRLGYVQSAVSQQIAHLEEMVGARLVDRQRGMSPVALTEAGELLMHHFDEVLARIGAAQADLEALRAGRAGQIRVGVYEWVAIKMMPRILVAFGQRLPGVNVQLLEARAAELAASVESGDLDLAFGDLPLPAGPFEARELRRDPYVLLAPKDWPLLPSEQEPTADELARMPLIAQAGSPAAERADADLRASGVEPRYTVSSGSPAAVQALVGAGLGAAIVPRLNVDEQDERTVVFELGDQISPRVMALYWHRERRRPPAFETFLEVAVQTCGAWRHITDDVGTVHQR